MSFSHSMLAGVLRALAQAVVKHPGWFVFPQIILSGLCVVYAAHGLKLDMDRDHLVGPGEKYFAIEQKFRKEFPGEDQLVLAMGNDRERNRSFIERLAAQAKLETNLFTRIYYKSDLTTLGPKALLLVPTSDLEQLRKSVDQSLPFLQKFSQTSNLDSLFGMVNEQFLAARRTTGQGKDLLKTLPALDNLVVNADRSISTPGPPAPPEIGQLFGGGKSAEEGAYLTYDDGRIFAMTFRFSSDAKAAQAIERMRQLIRETEEEVPTVIAGLTGRAVLEYDEMLQSRHDTTVAGLAALIICSLIFIISYREVRRPLKAAFCLLIGFGYTMGFTTLVIGHLNILSISFAPMLVGLGLDFGVQFITRYEEEMRHGLAIAEAMSKATVFTGQGIAVGGLTMAAAFLAMGITHFKGVREVGLICGGGLLLCLIAMMTALPALLMLGGRKVSRQKAHLTGQTRLKIERIWLQHPVVVVAIALLLCGVAVWQSRRVYFDYDLLHLQNRNLASVGFENLLLRSSGRSVMFASVMADSPQQALQFEQKLKSLPAVSGVDTAAGFLTGNQEKKLELIRGIKADLAGIRFAPVDRQPVQPEELSDALGHLKRYLGFSAAAAQKDRPDVASQLRSLRNHIIEFRRDVDGDEPQIPERLQHYQEALFAEIHGMIETLKNQDTSGPLRASDLPAVLRERFIGTTGKYLLQVYPKQDLWQRENQREFIQQLRSVVPADRMTGTPILVYHQTALLKNSYQQAAWYSLAAIIVMLFLHFRSPGYVMLALLPVGIGFIWLLGFMGATGIPFNPANIMALPLVIGVGVTNGIQILNRVAEEGEPGILTKSTGKAVLVSGLTAITGFATLLLGKDQGVRSLGQVMPVGIGACMIAGLTFLPALLILLGRRGWVMGNSQQKSATGLGVGWHWLRWHRHKAPTSRET